MALLVLALLWRRGPDRRGAFYVAGLVFATGSFVFAVAYEEVDRRIASLPEPTLPHVEIPGRSIDEVEPAVTRASERPAPASGTRPVAFNERIALAADAMLPFALEFALADLPEIEDCREGSSGAMQPATLVVICELEDGIELHLGRFMPSDSPADWFSSEAERAPSVSDPARADADCRTGRPAMGTYDGGSFACWEQGTQARVAWTDPERDLGGQLVSQSLSLIDLYRTWRD